ncbi:hypothetical protein JCM3775_001620 [Rhodotorula graminis]
MDTFAYHPPGLSLSPAQPHPHHLADDPATAAAFAARPGSSSGAGPSTGFTQTLPPLQEHVSSESAGPAAAGGGGGGAAGGRPTLVGFEQLTGEEPPVASTRTVYGEAPDGTGAVAHSLGGGFRDPFPGSSAAAAVNPYAQAPHAHSFFNPHPNVNMRNTRPMTAPSGPSYFNSPSYSAAPSAFYAPALQQQQQHHHQHQQQTSANAASTYGALDLAPAPPPHVPPGSSGGLTSSHSQATFQYSVDTSPNLDYDAFRARGFSLPDVGGVGASDPAGPDSASPSSSSTPFFYTPPSVAPGSALRTLQPAPPPPMAPADGYYPAVLDPAQALMPAPLTASTSAILPPSSDLPPPPASFLQQQRPQTGPTPSTRRGSTGGSGGAAGKQYNFVQQAGQSNKRPRRRFDEIERMYNCDYPGCTKAYGTLNHLNSHKTMQKHGPKSTPAQFKEMRKAWRERKKAEAATAARDRAAQPQPLPTPPSALGPPPDAGAGGLPSALGLPPHLNDRPRPSTSAGEYHFSMPAPFMTPLGAPMLAYPPPPPAAVPQSAPQGMFDAPHAYDGDAAAVGGPFALHDMYGGGAGHGGGGGGGGAMRPVTAPSYYVAPQFGAGSSSASSGLSHHPLAQPPTTAGSYVPPRLVSGQAGGAAFGVGAGAMGGDRRFSLPSSSLGYGPPPPPGTQWHSPQQDAIKRFYRQQYQREQEQELQQQQQHDAQQQQQQQQQPATTLEMPRPVLAGPNGYSALIHGGVTAAQASTAAEGGAGKLGGEDGGLPSSP